MISVFSQTARLLSSRRVVYMRVIDDLISAQRSSELRLGCIWFPMSRGYVRLKVLVGPARLRHIAFFL